MKKLKLFIGRPLLLILLLLTSLVAEAKPPTTVKQTLFMMQTSTWNAPTTVRISAV